MSAVNPQSMSTAPMRRKVWETLAVSWCAVVAGVLFARFQTYGFDDPFITYRYAENLAAGRGFVYNAGWRVLSTTTPFYTLLLAGLRLLGLDVPLTSNALGCLSMGVSAWTLWRLLRHWQMPVAATTALLLYPLTPLLIGSLGGEAPFAVMLVLLSLLAYVCGAYTWCAVALALATLTRADAVLAGIIMAAHFLIMRRRPMPWLVVLAFVAIIAPWFTFATLYFGAPLPVTLAAKQRQGLMLGSRSFFAGLGPSFLVGYWASVLSWPFLAAAIVGLGASLVNYRRVWLLLGWCVLYALAYTWLGVSAYFWYYVPLIVGLIVLVAVGSEATGRLFVQSGGRRWGLVGTWALLAIVVIPQGMSVYAMPPAGDGRLSLYRRVGEWVKQTTPPQASVGALEVGIIGYYAERTMIDFAGLIQPETSRQLTIGTTYEDAALWATDHYRPDYLILQAGLFPRVEDALRDTYGCQVATTFEEQDYPMQLVVYQCVW